MRYAAMAILSYPWYTDWFFLGNLIFLFKSITAAQVAFALLICLQNRSLTTSPSACIFMTSTRWPDFKKKL